MCYFLSNNLSVPKRTFYFFVCTSDSCVFETFICCLFCCSTNENSSVYMKSNFVGNAILFEWILCTGGGIYYILIDSMQTQRNLFDVSRIYIYVRKEKDSFLFFSLVYWRQFVLCNYCITKINLFLSLRDTGSRNKACIIF